MTGAIGKHTTKILVTLPDSTPTTCNIVREPMLKDSPQNRKMPNDRSAVGFSIDVGTPALQRIADEIRRAGYAEGFVDGVEVGMTKIDTPTAQDGGSDGDQLIPA